MYIVFAAVLIAHGLAHLPGFIVPWRIAVLKDMPYRTTLLSGRMDVGDGGARAFGVLWLVAALAFAAGGGALLARAPWWQPLTIAAVAYSFILSVLGWPDSRFGGFVNLGLVVLLVLNRGLHWLP